MNNKKSLRPVWSGIPGVARSSGIRITCRKATLSPFSSRASITSGAASAPVTLDPYTFADDVAEHFAGDGNYHDRTAEEILLEIMDGLADDKLTGFALRLILTNHIPIPREDETDFLAEAAAAFAPPQPAPRPAKTAKPNKTNKPTPIKTASKPAPNKKAAKKKAAA